MPFGDGTACLRISQKVALMSTEGAGTEHQGPGWGKGKVRAVRC